MNNLKKPMERLSELLDEMVDKMDIDENGNPDDAMRWATRLSDALVRLKRHAKADTPPAAQAEPVAAQHRFRHPQKTMPDWGAWQPADINHDRPLWTIDSQGYEVEYRLLYPAAPAAEVNQQLLEALKLISEYDISGAHKRSMLLILQNLADAAILEAQSQEEQQ